MTSGGYAALRTDAGAQETSLVRAVLEHKLLVGAIVLACALVGLAFAGSRTTTYTAQAGLLLEDPRNTALNDVRPVKDQLRYAADQVAVLRSIAVAVRASRDANAADPTVRVTPTGVQKSLAVTASETSNFVTISVNASTPRAAKTIANAVVAAYREVVRVSQAADNRASIRRLDGAIAASVERLAQLTRDGAPEARRQDVEAYLVVLRERRSDLLANSQLLGDGVGMFVAAEPGRAEGTPTTTILAVAIALGLVIGAAVAYMIEVRNPRISDALDAEALIGAPTIAEIPDFSRDDGTSVLPVLDAPGQHAAELFRFVAFGIELPRTQGESTDGDQDRSWQDNFPQLTDRELTVLDLIVHGLSSVDAAARLPGMTRSKVDAAVRSVCEKLGEPDREALVRRVQESGRVRPRRHGGGVPGIIAFCAASAGSGTSTLVANAAIAAALAGQRVLLVDGDSDERDLTRIFHHNRRGPGGEALKVLSLTDVLDGSILRTPERILGTPGEGSVSLVALNSRGRDPMKLFQSSHFSTALGALREHYDLIFLDVPPVLRYAYAGLLLRNARAVVAVVPHKAERRSLRLLRERFDLLDLSPVGLLYNNRPRRRLPKLSGTRARQAATVPTASPSPAEAVPQSTASSAKGRVVPSDGVRSSARVVVSSTVPSRPRPTKAPWRGAPSDERDRSAS